MTDDDPRETEADSLLREVAAAPAIPIPSDVATFVLLEPGTVIDGAFRIDARLGAGGMGVVYAARDLALERDVAIKLMRLERGHLGAKLPEVFEREARATARLNHPNIVTLHQVGRWNGLLYLVLERLRGETLNARMERGGVPLSDALAILEQVCRALVHTHAEGITHRDLKPHNVYLLAGGGVKVLDFGVSGLARTDAPAGRANGAARSTLSLAGTPGYMAPEQWSGAVQDARTDVWAIGVMLHQLVTGQLPFGTKPVEAGARAPSLADRLPVEAAGLAAIVDRCLEPRPEARFATATALLEQLAGVRDGLASTAAGPTVSAQPLATARVRERHRTRRIGVAVAAAAAGVAGVLMLGAPAHRACDAPDRVARLWNPAVRDRLAASLGRGAAWTEIARALDTYAGQWAPLRDAACRADATVATTCLDQRLTALGRYLDTAGTAAPEQALTSARALPALADCSDPGYLDRIAHPEGAVRRDPDALVPYHLVIAGRGRDIVHAATFVDGDLVIAAFASSDATIAGTPLATPAGADDRFGVVARIGSGGAARWAVVLDKASALSITTIGDAVAIGGGFVTGATLGGAAFPAAGSGNDGYVALLDAATGATRWVRTFGASKIGVARAVAADPAGNLYAVGDFTGTARFGGTIEHATGATTEDSSAVVSWSATGALRWAVTGDGNVSSRTWAIAATDSAVVVGAFMRGGGTLGATRLADAGCVIARLDRDTGAPQWIHQERGRDARCVLDSIALQGERIAVTGRRLDGNGGWVAELAATDGATRWVVPLGTEEQDYAKAVAFAPDGTLAVGGHYTTPAIAMCGDKLVSNGGWDAYVVELDPRGTCVAAVGFGGVTTDVVRWLGYGSDGRLVAAGRFETALIVGDRVLHGAGGFDGFLVELSPRLMRPRPRAGAASP